MNNRGRTWALVLAAGEGSRLRKLTTTWGISVPKQFCSLYAGLSLLHEALQRAGDVSPRERIYTVVAQDYRQWCEAALKWIPQDKVIVKPENRGTGNGILLPPLHIMEHDPAARELILEGALWSAFIVAARAQALLDLFTRRFPTIVAGMRAVAAHDANDPTEPLAASHLYRSLPEIDFSRHIAQGPESALRVLTVPPCGWSDLGTPARVAQALQRMPAPPAAAGDPLFPLSSHLNLAAKHTQLQASC